MSEKQVAAIVAVAAIGIAALSVALYGTFVIGNLGGSANVHTLTVSGTGQVYFNPDTAYIQLGVLTQNSSLAGATATNAQSVNELISRISGLDLPNFTASTQGYNIYPIYSQDKTPAIVGYSVTQNLRVVVRENVTKTLGTDVGRVIDAAVSAGANQVYSVQFTVSDKTSQDLRQQALQLASQQAESKARAIVQPLGLRVTGVQSVSEGSLYFPGPIAFASGAPREGTPIIPGQLTVSASVQVVYTVG